MVGGIIGWVVIILVVILIVRAIRKDTAKKKEEIISKYGFTAEQIAKFRSDKLWEGMPIDALHTGFLISSSKLSKNHRNKVFCFVSIPNNMAFLRKPKF